MQPDLTLLILLASLACIEGGWPRMTNPLKTVWSTFYPDDSECSGCSQNKIPVIEHDPVLTELRVEYVKQQILKKLRLSKPPEVSLSLSTLPKPLINGHVLELRPGEPLEPEKPAESFYGKTDQVVVFPNEGKCQDSHSFSVSSVFFLNTSRNYLHITVAGHLFLTIQIKASNL